MSTAVPILKINNNISVKYCPCFFGSDVNEGVLK